MNYQIKNFILFDMKIPFVSFNQTNSIIRKEILKSFEEFFDSNYYILGNNVTKFENAYSQFNQTKYCVGVSNGLDALHLALKTLEIGHNDEVIVPANTYIASVLAISYVGATPVFVEPRIDTYNINPNLIEDKITKKTKAIMPVHLYGQACEMEAIMQIAKKHNLYVIEDNAQSQGSSFKGKLTGSWGNINGTSFYPGKNLGALGDAGAITTNNDKLAEKVRMLRNYGSKEKYYNELVGFNMRLDECQASFLNIKLKYLNQWNNERKTIASWYLEYLKDLDTIELPKCIEGADHIYHLFVIKSKNRDYLQSHLTQEGITTLIHYPVPPHLQTAYQHLGLKKGDLPITESIASELLSLPIYPGLTQSEVEYVCEMIKLFF